MAGMALRRPLALAVLLALLLTTPRLTPVAAAHPAQSREATAALERARERVAAGEHGRAVPHVERALEAADASVRAEASVLGARASTALGRPDDVVRFALLWAEASTTPGPAPRATREVRDALELPATELDVVALATGLAARRAAAVEELVELAAERERQGGRDPARLLTAGWLRRAGLDLASTMPLVLEEARPRLRPWPSAPDRAHVEVLRALEDLCRRALTRGAYGEALEIARVLKGFGVQADFKDLRGERPAGMARWRARGAELVEEARAAMLDGEERPWTVEDLEWLASAEGQAFTRAHDSFASPGVAVSPRGWYRIESDCGYEALLAAARTIEGHHERLARHFGEDPFRGPEERQGIVRVVPDPSGLEAEGAPFFWVGGFQSGDTTVVRLTAGTVEGLGRVLTHELTHRFDGALHPGIPSWLAEGRAVWTGAAYGPVDAAEFEPLFASRGGLYGALVEGMAGADRLEAVVSGEPEDYRDNYTAGMALYVFLSTWFPGDATRMDDGTPVFRGRLIEFEDRGEHPRSGGPRFEDFVDTFCDGREGRPRSFEEFTELFRDFLAGFDPREPAPFAERYRGVEGGGRTWIYDEPTWTWDWNRAEPRFGQNQARVAGELLARPAAGPGAAAEEPRPRRPEEALAAYVWARNVDGFDPRTSRGLEALLELRAGGDAYAREALFAVRREGAGEPHASVALGRPADPAAFPTRLPAAGAYAERLASVATELRGAGLDGAAAVLDDQRLRLAGWLGVDAPDSAGAGAAARSFELGGWQDEELTVLDEDRRPGRFAVSKGGDVVLGRDRASSASGTVERRGGGVSFIRADRWFAPGVYEVSTRVTFTTGFNRLVGVVGWQTRDRNVRFTLTSGDFEYAIGESDEEPAFDSVRWRFDGLRPRDRGLPGAARSGRHALGRTSTSVEVRLRVEGPMVQAFIDGTLVGVYHAIDGQPFSGYVGFGTSAGVVELSPPVATLGAAPGRALDVASGAGPEFEDLENAPVRLGDLAEVPPNGAVLLWIPGWSEADPAKGKRADADASLRRTARTADQVLERMRRSDVAQPLLLVIDRERLASDDGQALAAQLATEYGDRVRVIGHGALRPADDVPVTVDGGRRWLMFVDSYGVARNVAPFTAANAVDDGAMRQWVSVFRDHGRPPRDLPAPERDGR